MTKQPPRPDIEGIKARAEKATERPWEWEYNENEGEYRISLAHMVLDGSDEDGLPGAFDDRAFITHARMDVPDLCAYALRLEKIVRQRRDLFQSQKGALQKVRRQRDALLKAGKALEPFKLWWHKDLAKMSNEYQMAAFLTDKLAGPGWRLEGLQLSVGDLRKIQAARAVVAEIEEGGR